MGWDLMISIILLVTCITTPFDLAFQEETDAATNYVIFRYVIDFLFGIDIIINFNSATQNQIFEIEDDRTTLSLNYFKGWFWVDFLSIIPFEFIVKSIAMSS